MKVTVYHMSSISDTLVKVVSGWLFQGYDSLRTASGFRDHLGNPPGHRAFLPDHC